MSNTVVKEIREAMTEINKLLDKGTTDEAKVASAAAHERLDIILIQLHVIQHNLAQWTPGPSERK